MSKLLRFRKYDPKWKEEFERIQTHLDALLTTLILDIHHVGSTSVETMSAKPIIDISIEYESHLEQIIQILEQNNYIYEGEKGIKDRHSFKQLDYTFYEHHLYVCLKGSDNLVNQLLLKRALQNHPEFRKQYSEIKQQLIQANNKDRVLYTESKTGIIQYILKEESRMKSIVLAGGCFWGVEAYFKQLDGVNDTEVGYINGRGQVTYEEVCAGSGHAEAVLIHYDEERISLKKLLDHFFNIIDPTSINRQGPDVGVQYRTGIYNFLEEDRDLIENYIQVRQKEYVAAIMIERAQSLTFFPAEEYHQDYLDKNKRGYCHVDLKSYKNVK